jgi:transcriptional regulator with XRE-family HTH domain
MIATGRQIAAARALLGWSQDKLAEASKLHPNSIGYWEAHDEIETGKWRVPVAIERIRAALLNAGVETFLNPSPGVRIVGKPRYYTQYAHRCAHASSGLSQISDRAA